MNTPRAFDDFDFSDNSRSSPPEEQVSSEIESELSEEEVKPTNKSRKKQTSRKKPPQKEEEEEEEEDEDEDEEEEEEEDEDEDEDTEEEEEVTSKQITPASLKVRNIVSQPPVNKTLLLEEYKVMQKELKQQESSRKKVEVERKRNFDGDQVTNGENKKREAKRKRPQSTSKEGDKEEKEQGEASGKGKGKGSKKAREAPPAASKVDPTKEVADQVPEDKPKPTRAKPLPKTADKKQNRKTNEQQLIKELEPIYYSISKLFLALQTKNKTKPKPKPKKKK